MTDKNADVVLTVVLTTAAEYSTLWEEKAKAATGNDYSHRMMKAQTLAMADLCALLAERNELQKQTLDAMTEQTGEMQVRNSIALDALNLERERWQDSTDTGRLAARMLASQTRMPEVMALWNREHPLQPIEARVTDASGRTVPTGIKC